MEALIDAALLVGIRLTTAQQAQYRRYFELLQAGSEIANLTGARGWDRVRDELIVRSLRFLAPVAGGSVPSSGWFAGSAGRDGPTRGVLDVGTGAGVPGLVLKLAVPTMEIALMDSNGKKCGFLRQAIAEMELRGVTVIEARAEEAARDRSHREAYDVVLARGVARLAELAELTMPFARVGGTVIAAKGVDVNDEIAESGYAAAELGAAPAIAYSVAAPGQAAPDSMVCWMKVRATPDRYPRRNGVPHKEPLVAAKRALARPRTARQQEVAFRVRDRAGKE